MKPLNRLLFVAMRYDYGRIEQGLSFEHTNFYRALQRMIPEVVEFDFMTIFRQEGRKQMNALLIEKAEKVSPDLILFVLYRHELLPRTIETLSTKWTTMNWFCDDHWRFSGFSRFYAPSFSFVSTTDPEAIPKYESMGYRNALLTQWACNHNDYRRLPGRREYQHSVTFIGQPHGDRKRVIRQLVKGGLPVEAFGRGWENGRIGQEEMIGIFNASRVNLNLSNSSVSRWGLRKRPDQIKGRNFEIPGCGGFLLTNDVPGLNRFYELGKEIVTFRDTSDLAGKIRYYLDHEKEREEIADRGYERTLRDHTYEQRFRSLFERMGFTR